MDNNFLFNMGLMVVFIGLGMAYLFWVRQRAEAKLATECDPQLLLIHRFLNESFTDLLGQLTNKIEDHFETEYSDNQWFLDEQLKRQRDMAVDFTAYCGSQSCYPGYPVHVTSFVDDRDEADLYAPWVLTVSTGPAEHREFVIPCNNIAYLIDRLTDLNDYNAKLIEMIKASEE